MTLKNAEGAMIKTDADRLNGGNFSMICVLIQCPGFVEFLFQFLSN